MGDNHFFVVFGLRVQTSCFKLCLEIERPVFFLIPQDLVVLLELKECEWKQFESFTALFNCFTKYPLKLMKI